MSYRKNNPFAYLCSLLLLTTASAHAQDLGIIISPGDVGSVDGDETAEGAAIDTSFVSTAFVDSNIVDGAAEAGERTASYELTASFDQFPFDQNVLQAFASGAGSTILTLKLANGSFQPGTTAATLWFYSDNDVLLVPNTDTPFAIPVSLPAQAPAIKDIPLTLDNTPDPVSGAAPVTVLLAALRVLEPDVDDGTGTPRPFRPDDDPVGCTRMDPVPTGCVPADTPTRAITSVAMELNAEFVGCAAAADPAVTSMDFTLGLQVIDNDPNDQIPITPINDGQDTPGPVDIPADSSLVSCGAAYGLTIASDTDMGGGNSSYVPAVEPVGYFIPSSGNTAGPATDRNADGTNEPGIGDTAMEATHGVVEISFNPDGVASEFHTSLASGPLTANADGTVATGLLSGVAGELTQLDLNFTLPGTGIKVGLGAPGNITDISDTTTQTAQIVSTQINSLALATNSYKEGIVLQLPADLAISEIIRTEVNVTSAALTYNGGSISLASSMAIDDFNAANTTECGVFDWVGDGSLESMSGAGTLIRVTGANPGTAGAIYANFSNSSAGNTKNGAFAVNFDAASLPASLIIDSNMLNVANSNFGVADVVLAFENFDSVTNLDCDRLITSPADGSFFAPYGNDRSYPVATGLQHGDDKETPTAAASN